MHWSEHSCCCQPLCKAQDGRGLVDDIAVVVSGAPASDSGDCHEADLVRLRLHSKFATHGAGLQELGVSADAVDGLDL